MITVIIPLYNKATTIRRCLRSVLSQTILPNELIVINDGSQDESLDVVKEMVDSSSLIDIKIIDQENHGVSFTRNRGVSLATNDFIAFLDADDEWNEKFIEHAQEIISTYQDISLVTFKHRVCDEDIGSYIPKQYFGSKDRGLIKNYFALARCFPIVNSSKAVVNKLYFEKVGGFPIDAKVSEDLYLWIKLSECAPIAYFEELLVTIYQAPDNSRGSRVGQIPYPIVYYSSKHCVKNLDNDLYLLLWSIHLKHVLGSCAKNKKEALVRILYGIKLFKLKGVGLLFLLFVPKYIFNRIRVWRRMRMVKLSAQ